MKTKEFFFLDGDEKKGPILFNDFIIMNLPEDTLVWYDELEDWKKIKEIEELKTFIKPKKTPPPPPKPMTENIHRTEISGQIKVDSSKKDSIITESLKKSPNAYLYLVSWCTFHLFALLMSYSEIHPFNKYGHFRTDEFWPFVDYYSSNPYYRTPYFYGIFNEYDWTEFAFYVGSATIIFILFKISQLKK